MLRRSLLVVATLGLASCDRYAHGLHRGSLADVARRSVTVCAYEGTYVLSVSNTGRDGACLVLDSLEARVDGVAQRRTTDGGRSTGQHKGDFGPVNRTDACEAATFAIARSTDRARTSNLVEVRDATATIRLETPNVLVETEWTTPPPAKARPGSELHVRVAPVPPRGSGATDASSFLAASLVDSVVHNGARVELTTRLDPDGTIVLGIPADTRSSAFTLYLGTFERSVPALACTAADCTVESEFTLTAPLTVTP